MKDEYFELPYIQKCVDAINRHQYKMAFSILRRSLNDLEDEFGEEHKLVKLIREFSTVIYLLEYNLEKDFGMKFKNAESGKKKTKEQKNSNMEGAQGCATTPW